MLQRSREGCETYIFLKVMQYFSQLLPCDFSAEEDLIVSTFPVEKPVNPVQNESFGEHAGEAKSRTRAESIDRGREDVLLKASRHDGILPFRHCLQPLSLLIRRSPGVDDNTRHTVVPLTFLRFEL